MDVFENHLAGIGRALTDLVLFLAAGNVRGVGWDHEYRDTLVTELGVFGSKHRIEAGHAAVGDEALGAVDDILITLATGRGPYGSNVRPGICFSEAERG